MAVKWYYNSTSGNIIDEDENNPLFQVNLHSGLGWHGPFNTKQDAQNYYTTNKANNPGWHAPTGSLLAKIGNASGATDAIAGASPFSNQNISNWFIRIAEVLLGIVLAGIGIAKLTGTQNIISQHAKAAIS